MDGAASVLAIVGAAGTAVKVIKQLRDFVSDVQVVDETVQGLCNEVESLQTVLELISNSFAKIEPILEEDGPIRRVWECVEQTGDDCLQAIGKLNQILRRLGKGSTSTYRAIVKQLKFQSETNEIAEIRRQLSSHQMAFQTSLTSIILCIVSQDQQPNPNVLDVVFGRLEDRLDELTYHLKDLKASQQDREDTSVASNDSEELIENLEACKESANVIYDTALSVVNRHSTTGSEAANPLTSAQKDRIFDWAQRSCLSTFGTEEQSLDDRSTVYCESTMGSDTTSPTTVYGGDRVDIQTNTRIVSGLKLSVRSELTKRGIVFYYNGSFSVALSCFQEAKSMGTVGSLDLDPLGDVMPDERLKLWLTLAEVRGKSHSRRASRRSKSNDSKLYLGSGKLDVARLRSSAATVHDCVDACILAQIYIYLRDLSQAEAICDAALDRLEELRSTVSDPNALQNSYLEYQYQYAIIVMVKVLYSGGLTEGIKAWRTRVSLKTLRNEAAPFMLPSAETTQHDSQTRVSRRYHYSTPQKNLQQAISDGCFFRALFLLSTFEGGSLKMAIYQPELDEAREVFLDSDQTPHYMVQAMKSDCHALVSLLIEHWDDITNQHPNFKSTAPVATRNEIVHYVAGTDDRAKKSKALYLAIDFNLPRAVEHLLAIGAGKDHVRQMAVDGEVTCYDTSKDCYSCPLGYAVSLGKSAMCRLLLKSGATVNGPGGKVEPPLHSAIRCREGRFLVPLLIEAGADLNLKFKDVRPLALAIFRSGSITREKMVEVLLDNGADPKKSSLISRVKKTPLEQTVGNVQMAGVARLLRRRKETQRRGSKGRIDNQNSLLSTAWERLRLNSSE